LNARLDEELQFAKFETSSDATHPARTEEIALPIAAIRKYLECPLQGAARYSLGMLEDEDAPEEAEDEPIEQTRLNRAVMLRNVFWRAGGKSEAIGEEYAREVRIAQTYGNAPAGLFAEAAEESDTSALCKWIAQAVQAGVSDFDGWNDIRIGRADEFADASEILSPIILNAEVRRHDGTTVTQRVSLYGTIRGVSPEAGVAINCVVHKTLKRKDFLPAYLNAVALAAVGTKLSDKFRAIVIGTESKKPAEWTREFLPMDRNSAIAYLADVVSDLLSTGNDYFLPIEAVEKVAKQMDDGKKPRDLVDAVEQVLLTDPPKCSSDYGPVRNARDFDPPEEEQIQNIVERRFDPIGLFK
jgi:exodeoxyribonuclease V gamma subunit